MSALWQDIRYALRTLRRSPGFTLVMVLTLALGIGANTALFSVVDGVLLKPLPYAGGDALFRLRQDAPKADLEDQGVSVQELVDYRHRNHTLAGLVEYHSLWFTLLNRGEPERVQSGVVSWNWFDVVGVKPILGRTFTADEDRVGAAPVLLLGYEFWNKRFGGDPKVVGRTVVMNDQVHTIVGVLPPLPSYPDRNDVWMPWYACPFRSGPHWQENRQMRALLVLGRVKPGSTVGQAQADVSRMARQMETEHPEAYPAQEGFRAVLLPLKEELTREARPTFLVLLGVAGFVLLIACANVANLTLARLWRREGELAVRAALGAGRRRLARQFFTESLLLSGAGAALGLVLASTLVKALAEFSARLTPRSAEIGIDGRVLGFTLLLAVGTALLVALAPAALVGRNVSGTLRAGGRGNSTSAGRVRLRGALVAGQVAVTFVLLVGAGLMIRSFVELMRVNPGFDPENVLTAQVDLDFTAYTDPVKRKAMLDGILERLQAIPGVSSAGMVSSVPLTGITFTTPIQLEGAAADPGAPQPKVSSVLATPGYFDALRIPLVRGRGFQSTDGDEAPQVALVARSTAHRLWGDRDPVGRRFTFPGSEDPVTVVGVVGDVRQEGLDHASEDLLYLPISQNRPLSVRLVVRSRVAPERLGRSVVGAVQSLDPRQPVAFVRTLEDVRGESVAAPRLTATLLGLFAALALAISVAGILGLVAYSVNQRTREIGVRLALGARAADVLRMVVGQGVRVVFVGLVVGGLAALALGRLIAGLLFGVRPTDPATFVAVAAVLLGSAVAAAYVPALRAARVRPVEALRAE